MTVKIEERRFLRPDGKYLVGDVGGDATAPPVMLLHGGGQTRHSWGSAMEELVRRGYFVINLDSRGHGDSDWAPDGNYSIDAQAADLHGVIKTLPRPPALIGASMGGITAMFLVGSNPGPVSSALILVDITPRPDPAGAKRIVAFMQSKPEGFANLAEAADAVAAYYPERTRPKDASGLMKNLRLREDGRLHWHWDPRFLDMPERNEPPQRTERVVEASKSLTVPTLLVRGLRSDIVTDSTTDEFRKNVPHLEVFEVPEAGHMVAGDKNDAFNSGIVQFLNRHVPLG